MTTSYDEVAYPGYAFPRSHPGNLAAMAFLVSSLHVNVLAVVALVAPCITKKIVHELFSFVWCVTLSKNAKSVKCPVDVVERSSQRHI